MAHFVNHYPGQVFFIGKWSMIRFAVFSLVRTRFARLRCDFKNAIDQAETVNGMQIHFATVKR